MIIMKIKESIRARFLIRIIPTILVILIIFSVVIINYYLTDVNHQKMQNLEKNNQLMKVNISNAIWQFDYDYVENYLNTLQNYENFIFINIISENEVIFRFKDENFINYKFQDFSESKRFITNEIQLEHNGYSLGLMQVVVKKEEINSTVKSIILSMILLLTLIIIGITIVIILSSSQLIFKPLNKLGGIVSKVSTGNLNVSSDLKGEDEIGKLAQNFNDMIKNLRNITISRDALNEEIFKRKEIETELKNRNYYIETLLMNLPVGIILSTLDKGKILYTNKKFYEIHGYDGEDLKSISHLKELFFPKNKAGNDYFSNVQKTDGIAEKLFWKDLNVTTQDGQEIFTTVHIIPLPDQNLLISTVQDTTKRKLAEDKVSLYQEKLENMINERTKDLKEKTLNYENSQLALSYLMEDSIETSNKLKLANIQLEAANKELESFSYSISHDLRAPLRAISGFSSILEEDYINLIDEKGKEYLQIIKNNTEMMGRLINELLDFSRLSKKDIRKSSIDMNKLVQSIIEDEPIYKDNQKIDYNISNLLPAEGDPTMINQVLTNLISNAIKYSSTKEESKISITSETMDDNIIYKISDNGVGFEMKYSKKIFGVFQRLHAANEFEGTGVGLAIAQRIIHKHGGKIWVESEEHIGSTFYFTLPASKID